MSFSLKPHPIGIKWWTDLWRANKDLSGKELHAKFSDYVYHKTHRSLGQYFFAHRAGPLGVKAPLVVMFVGLKLGAMAYGSHRDRAAAVDVAAAYGMGGHMLDATPNCTYANSPAKISRRIADIAELGELAEFARTKTSVVYKATFEDRSVAVKEIKIASLSTQQAVDHIMNERQILTLLSDAQSAYAPRLVGTVKTPDALYLVMEFVEGQLLTEFLKQKGSLIETEIKLIFHQIVLIISDLHSKGILYRDLKLTNLIIRDNQIRIIDYGLSKLIGAPPARTRSVCGTIHAMSPELAIPPEQGYGFEIDCWALGVLLFELCEYRAPFGYRRDETDFLKSPECLCFRNTEQAMLRELIERLLTVPVNDRFTISDILAHPWILSKSERLSLAETSGRHPGPDSVLSAADDPSFWDSY